MESTPSVNTQVARALAGQSGTDAGDLRRAAAQSDPAEGVRAFEEVLGKMLAREMRRGLDEGFFGSGPGSATFASWLDDFVGRTMAERGALGAEDLFRGVVPQEPGSDPGGRSAAPADEAGGEA